ncbi:MAG: hypothetical protein OXG55_09530 [bacterium]|nr:hypothetical protein [bacterium]MCY3953486.1 hypothetical protein [bacterium]MCY4103486.1 hypothetical protein [bacterium]
MSVLLLDDSTGWLGEILSDGASEGTVLAACDPPADWSAVEERLVDAFHAARECVAQGAPLVYIVHSEDLRGTRSALASALATALIGCARAVAYEFQRDGAAANVVALPTDADRPGAARVIGNLLADPVLTGELLDLGSAKLGKLQP